LVIFYKNAKLVYHLKILLAVTTKYGHITQNGYCLHRVLSKCPSRGQL